jgi:hypothetical protein
MERSCETLLVPRARRERKREKGDWFQNGKGGRYREEREDLARVGCKKHTIL